MKRCAIRWGLAASLAVPVLVLAGSSPVAGVVSAADACAAPAGPELRVRPGASAQEPPLHPNNEAKAYGVLKDRPTLSAGSVQVPTVFHVVSDHVLTTDERGRRSQMITDQVGVLNDAFNGSTASGAADTPFRFQLTDTTWTVNPAWSTGAMKREREMKKALHVGNATTLNVYVLNLGGGLLGYAYFPKQYNAGRDLIDGVVLLDESMPGGTADIYAEGDTLTHEVGHWFGLYHTFQGGCSASGDFVADTAREAAPQFECPADADSCPAPGSDPVHNFMDYSPDACLDMFTQGQADRMSDAWRQFRAGGN